MTGTFHASPVNKAAEWESEKPETVQAAQTQMSFADLEAVAGVTE
jgi:hypothetical protein